MQPKAAIFVGFIALLAFAWGYTKDSLSFDLSAIWNAIPKADSPAEEPPLVGAPLVAGGSASSAPPAIQHNPSGMGPSSMGFNPFAGNIDAIQGDPSETAPMPQRNAYFDKLSQQMRELQQQTSLNSVTVPEAPVFPIPTESMPPSPPPTFDPNPQLLQPEPIPPPDVAEEIDPEDENIDDDVEGEEIIEDTPGEPAGDLAIQ